MSSVLKYSLSVVLCIPILSQADTVTVEPSQDAWINTASETTNYGTANHMEVYTDTTFPPPNRSGLVQFNLPTLPQMAVLQAATLSLYYYDNIYMDSDDVLGVGVYAIEVLHGYLTNPGLEYQRRDWTEYEVTWRQFKSGASWQTYGCEDTFYDRWATPDATLTFQQSTPYGWKTWTVTDRVAQWYSGADINRGWLVRVSSIGDNDNAGVMLYTKEGTYHPQLTITYVMKGACCFDDGHCQELTQAACTQAGGTQWLTGVPCIPNPCPQPPGACCFTDGHCEYLTQAECSGSWLGYGTDCTPNPCPQPTGACCFPDGHCEDLTQAECTGNWLGYGTKCTPINPCPQPPTGACCFGTICQIKTEAQCLAGEGEYRGDGTDCFPNPCTTLNYWLRVAGGVAVEMGGDGYNHEWYRYPKDWWNQWWPNEFAPDRQKQVTITFDIEFLMLPPPVVAFNYSAFEWPDEQNPPLPADEAFVVRVPVEPPITMPGAYTFTTRLPFCPRWVSMDVQGQEFTVQGTIVHTCLPYPRGGCCFPGCVCELLTAQQCADAEGIYMGDHVPCIPSPCVCPADTNCDGIISYGDINPFVLALQGRALYEEQYPACRWLNADINGDGNVTYGDINPFVICLSQGHCD